MTLSAQDLRFRLSIFFFLSGATSLVYEILWARELGLIFGNTTYAVSIVLAAFMAGLGFGGLAGGRIADRSRDLLFLYGVLELGIALWASGTFLFSQAIESAYVAFFRWASPGATGLLLIRVVLAFFMVFIPAFLMGATLPVLIRFIVRIPAQIGSGTAWLYGLNTAGAMTGTLAAGFWLIPSLGMRRTLIAAVVVNAGIGVLACLLARRQGATAPHEPAGQGVDGEAVKGVRQWLPAALFVSGMAAMLEEVAWTRALASVMGSSTYAFSVMLGVFLGSMAIGSFVYSKRLEKQEARMADWAFLQALIALSVLLVLPFFDRVDFLLFRLIPLGQDHPDLMNVFRFLICGFFMLLPAFGFGALFPVSTALYTRGLPQLGSKVGWLYGMNTAGNIVGSLAAGFVLIQWIGIHATLMTGVFLNTALAVGAFFFLRPFPRRVLMTGVICGGLLAVAIWQNREGWSPIRMTAGLHLRPGELLDKPDRDVLASTHMRHILFYREGLHSIVNVDQLGSHRHLRVNSKVDASTSVDMVTQQLLGHLPHLLHPAPRQSLVIGFGSGVTLAASLAHPVERVDAVEIESAVIEAAPFFDSVNRGAYRDPRANLELNDGRNHLLLKKPQTYDVVISEPSNPWISGVAYLFSTDFYALVQSRLAPGGIFCQWLQAYEIAPADFQMVVASVAAVFPHVTLWKGSEGDMLLIASDQKIVFRFDAIEERIQASEALRKDLASMGIDSASGLLSFFLLNETDTRRLAQTGQLNTDDQLRLEFSAPRHLYDRTLPLIREVLKNYQQETLPDMVTTRPAAVNRPDLLAAMGQSHAKTGNWPAAKTLFEEAIEANPDHRQAWTGLAQYHLEKQKQPEFALKILSRMETLYPDRAEIHQLAGRARILLDEPAAALKSFEAAVRLDPENASYLFDRAKAFERMHLYQAAQRSMEQSLNLNSNQPEGWGDLIRYQVHAGQHEESLRLLQEKIREYPSYMPFYSLMLEIAKRQGNWNTAEEAYEYLLSRNPWLSEAWLELIRIYLKNGKDQHAAEALERLEKVNPLTVEALRVSPGS